MGTNRLLLDLPDAEGSDGDTLEMYSNGYKVITADAFINANNNTYMGIAFADQPFKYANAR
jgi:hypothetical protein